MDLIESIHAERVDIINNQTTRIHIQKREILDIVLKKRGNKKVVIIMMNPSKADDEKSDDTINSIIDYFSQDNCYVGNEEKKDKHQLRIIDDIKYVCIRNLFSIYNPSSLNLYNNINEVIANRSYEYLDDLIKYIKN